MNNLNLPYRVPLQIIVDVYREEGLALKWVSRPRHSNSTVIKFPKHKGQANLAERLKRYQETIL